MNLSKEEKSLIKDALELYIMVTNMVDVDLEAQKERKELAYSTLEKILTPDTIEPLNSFNTASTSHENLMTVPQVSNYLKVGKTAVYELIRTKELRSLNIGARKTRISYDDLMDYVVKTKNK